jgi:hypothetical protein
MFNNTTQLSAIDIQALFTQSAHDVSWLENESAMNSDEAREQERKEETIIIPRVGNILAQMHPQKTEAVELCFREMRAFVLDKIIEQEAEENRLSSLTATPCRDFIEQNKQTLVELNGSVMLANGISVMMQARNLLSGVPETSDRTSGEIIGGSIRGSFEAAWRYLAFKEDGVGGYQSAFIGPNASDEIRLRCAYTWLLSAHPGLAGITPAEQANAQLELLHSLAYCRREHNDDAGEDPLNPIDRCSCHSGVKSRIALCWGYINLLKTTGISIEQAVVTPEIWRDEIVRVMGIFIADYAGVHGEDAAVEAIDRILEEDFSSPHALQCYQGYINHFLSYNGTVYNLDEAVYHRMSQALLASHPHLHTYLRGDMHTKSWVKQYLMPVILHPLTLPRLVTSGKVQILYTQLLEVAKRPQDLHTILPQGPGAIAVPLGGAAPALGFGAGARFLGGGMPAAVVPVLATAAQAAIDYAAAQSVFDNLGGYAASVGDAARLSAWRAYVQLLEGHVGDDAIYGVLINRRRTRTVRSTPSEFLLDLLVDRELLRISDRFNAAAQSLFDNLGGVYAALADDAAREAALRAAVIPVGETGNRLRTLVRTELLRISRRFTAAAAAMVPALVGDDDADFVSLQRAEATAQTSPDRITRNRALTQIRGHLATVDGRITAAAQSLFDNLGGGYAALADDVAREAALRAAVIPVGETGNRLRTLVTTELEAVNARLAPVRRPRP